MPSLAEIQSRLRDAVVRGEAGGIAPLLAGGLAPGRRLTIHQRHYRASLVSAIRSKFPATAWLVGASILDDVASDFVREHPPTAPCMAEYGRTFPQFLSTRSMVSRLPYLCCFAELEWHIGEVAIAVDLPALTLAELAGAGADDLVSLRLTLQPGIRYRHLSWPVDELMRLFLADSAPERYELSPLDVRLEVRGARGSFVFSRIEHADYIFRTGLLAGLPIGQSAERALDACADFDPGRAFSTIVQSGCVVSSQPACGGSAS